MLIDCNKKDYNAYCGAALELLSVGGIVIDSTFRNGSRATRGRARKIAQSDLDIGPKVRDSIVSCTLRACLLRTVNAR